MNTVFVIILILVIIYLVMSMFMPMPLSMSMPRPVKKVLQYRPIDIGDNKVSFPGLDTKALCALAETC
jgi:hypothetical protein